MLQYRGSSKEKKIVKWMHAGSSVKMWQVFAICAQMKWPRHEHIGAILQPVCVCAHHHHDTNIINVLRCRYIMHIAGPPVMSFKVYDAY